jgi:hypothetical protein
VAEPLRLVNPDTGELVERPNDCPHCAGKDATIKTMGDSNARLRGRITELLQEAEENHESFPSFKRCHDYWREQCNHPRSKYEIDDFKLWLPFYDKYGLDTCLRAIDGAAFEPFISTRKNGSEHRHDDWELIHRSGGHKFKEFVNKAPYHMPKPEHLSILCRAIWWRHPDWENEQIMAAAKLRVRRWAL